MTPREEIDIAALDFLNRVGKDTMTAITNENEMAAALVYIGLKERGLVVSSIDATGHTYRITPKGAMFLNAKRGTYDAAEYLTRALALAEEGR